MTTEFSGSLLRKVLGFDWSQMKQKACKRNVLSTLEQPEVVKEVEVEARRIIIAARTDIGSWILRSGSKTGAHQDNAGLLER